MIGRRYTIGGGLDEWTVICRAGPPFNVGGPSGNVLIERDDGHRIVRPFRGLRRVVPAGRRNPSSFLNNRDGQAVCGLQKGPISEPGFGPFDKMCVSGSGFGSVPWSLTTASPAPEME